MRRRDVGGRAGVTYGFGAALCARTDPSVLPKNKGFRDAARGPGSGPTRPNQQPGDQHESSPTPATRPSTRRSTGGSASHNPGRGAPAGTEAGSPRSPLRQPRRAGPRHPTCGFPGPRPRSSVPRAGPCHRRRPSISRSAAAGRGGCGRPLRPHSISRPRPRPPASLPPPHRPSIFGPSSPLGSVPPIYP